ncbi:Uncharacterized membrane protein [Halogranum gelatinilyticum]|uniref:Uncharacterized membrane protein n=1 Tax=Halogranum gelatinilyticum TaxID=660521 RepID=A0A1G9UN90_9EURY|nr:DUF1616 domain-containing protein [Halogranum gelatinilyticum]SDM61422.1 Uncharacterized membrane protein [Halogranum gelatinilyticum]
MTTHPPSRRVDDVVDIVWPVLVLSGLLAAATMLAGGSAARLLLTLLAVLLFPGYVLSLFVFPLAKTPGDDPTERVGDGSGLGLAALGTTERWAVALGFSICLMPLYGLLITLAELPFALRSVMGVVVGVVTVLTVLALVRRLRLRVDAPVLLPGRPTPLASLRAATASRSTGRVVSNAVIVVTLLAAVSALAVGITLPPAGSQYTTASLLTVGENGSLVAAGYPHDLAPEETAELVLVLSNNEGTATDYTVVVQSQRVALDGTVTETRYLDEFSTQLRNGETWERPHEVAPLLDGDRVRLAYLVYRGSPPADPTVENAYRSLTLWVREPMPGATSETEAAAVVAVDVQHDVAGGFDAARVETGWTSATTLPPVVVR